MQFDLEGYFGITEKFDFVALDDQGAKDLQRRIRAFKNIITICRRSFQAYRNNINTAESGRYTPSNFDEVRKNFIFWERLTLRVNEAEDILFYILITGNAAPSVRDVRDWLNGTGPESPRKKLEVNILKLSAIKLEMLAELRSDPVIAAIDQVFEKEFASFEEEQKSEQQKLQRIHEDAQRLLTGLANGYTDVDELRRLKSTIESKFHKNPDDGSLVVPVVTQLSYKLEQFYEKHVNPLLYHEELNSNYNLRKINRRYSSLITAERIRAKQLLELKDKQMVDLEDELEDLKVVQEKRFVNGFRAFVNYADVTPEEFSQITRFNGADGVEKLKTLINLHYLNNLSRNDVVGLVLQLSLFVTAKSGGRLYLTRLQSTLLTMFPVPDILKIKHPLLGNTAAPIEHIYLKLVMQSLLKKMKSSKGVISTFQSELMNIVGFPDAKKDEEVDKELNAFGTMRIRQAPEKIAGIFRDPIMQHRLETSEAAKAQAEIKLWQSSEESSGVNVEKVLGVATLPKMVQGMKVLLRKYEDHDRALAWLESNNLEQYLSFDKNMVKKWREQLRNMLLELLNASISSDYSQTPYDPDTEVDSYKLLIDSINEHNPTDLPSELIKLWFIAIPELGSAVEQICIDATKKIEALIKQRDASVAKVKIPKNVELESLNKKKDKLLTYVRRRLEVESIADKAIRVYEEIEKSLASEISSIQGKYVNSAGLGRPDRLEKWAEAAGVTDLSNNLTKAYQRIKEFDAAKHIPTEITAAIKELEDAYHKAYDNLDFRFASAFQALQAIHSQVPSFEHADRPENKSLLEEWKRGGGKSYFETYPQPSMREAIANWLLDQTPDNGINEEQMLKKLRDFPVRFAYDEQPYILATIMWQALTASGEPVKSWVIKNLMKGVHINFPEDLQELGADRL